MPNLAAAGPDSRFMALFIGQSGSGKTSAGASFPGRIKNYDFDGRIKGILGCPWLADRTKDIDYVYFPPEPGFFKKVNDDFDIILMEYQRTKKVIYNLIQVDSLTSETFGLLSEAIPLTHGSRTDGGSKGKSIGVLNMPGPEDYGFEANGTYQLMSFLRKLPCNIIVTAHLIDKYGKKDPNDKYSESIVIGEKLSLRDKIGENVKIYFDHIFKFEKEKVGGRLRHFVTTRDELCRTTFSKIPDRLDITDKNFYETIMQYA